MGSPDNGQTVLCVNASSGQTLWSYDVGSPMYQPTAYNGLLMFGAYGGNFYALHLSDGTLAWKTHVTDQNGQTRMAGQDPNYPLSPVVSLVQIDPRNERVFWSFAFIQNGWGGTDQYVGLACSIDLASGDRIWTRSIENNVSIAGGQFFRPTTIGLTLLNDNVFLTAGYDLWILNGSTGSIRGTQHYDHYILPPVEADAKVFVAADLYLIAYG